MKLHVRFLSGSSRIYEANENHIKCLEESRATGFIFIKLGNINYNVNVIESWWISDELKPAPPPPPAPPEVREGRWWND